MQLGPDLRARPPHEQPHRLARVAERQHEEPRAPVLARLAVADHRPVAVVDLGFLAGRGRDHDARLGRRAATQLRPRSAGRSRSGQRKPWSIDQVLPDRHRVAPASTAPPRSPRGTARTHSRSGPDPAADAPDDPPESVDTSPEMAGFDGPGSVDTPPANGRFCRPTSTDAPTCGLVGGRPRPRTSARPPSGTRSPSPGGRPSPPRSASATSPAAPAPRPVVASRRSRRCPSRRRNTTPAPSSTSRPLRPNGRF